RPKTAKPRSEPAAPARAALAGAAGSWGGFSRRASLRLDVVAEEGAALVQEEFAAADHRVRDRLAPAAAGRAEAALLLVAVRLGLPQGPLAVLAAGVQHPVGRRDGRLADAAVVPLLLAGLEVEADQAARVGAVDVVADAHDAAVVVGQVAVLVDLLG